MDRDFVAAVARALAFRSEATGEPIMHATVWRLAFLAGGDRGVVDDAMADGFAEVAAERRRADPAFWEA